MTWGIWQIVTRALQSLKIGSLMRSFYPKYKMHELKNYRGVICHNNEEWYKIWRGVDLSFQNWHEQFAVFLIRKLKSVKNLHFNGLLLNKVYNVWAKKSTEELYLMALKIYAKFEGKLTCALQNSMRSLANFHRLKNINFILKSKMAEQIKIKIRNN